ncbi:hypothetical protein [Lactobacillus bombicola]|uniref:Uncharacterized protein n=1 Tax=Lactobacillus bombicola TaxID=1505723 RepID=A0A396SP95_9LACO|nr:hypothetical protein [Lactobacillus bombicola]RHW53732.1 hypothetical protein DS835_07275 [Lactobacillus bombicola]
MKHKISISFVVLILLINLFIFAKPTTVNAANYKPYSYWIKRDLYNAKEHKAVLTKNIKIRKIRWHKEGVGHQYLAEKKWLKKGTHVKILANKQGGYYWALLGKYSNWVYPHKTANWFK